MISKKKKLYHCHFCMRTYEEHQQECDHCGTGHLID